MKNEITTLSRGGLINEFTESEQMEAIKIRNRIIAENQECKYLLPVEMAVFIRSELDSNKRLLYTLLYATGARISELLQVKVNDVKFDELTYIQLYTAKMNAKNRTKTTKNPVRVVDIEKSISEKLKSYIYTNKIKGHETLFNITSRTAENWCKSTQKTLLERDDVTLPFNVTPKVFRHSFAINHLYSGTNIKIISKYLGHKEFKTTEVYTSILAIETALKRQHIKFDV